MLVRLAVLIAICLPAGLAAEPVKLTTLDGSMTVEGDVISIDGQFLRLQTDFGPLTLELGNVTCEGPGCPSAGALVARASVAGPADMIHRLLPPLLNGFAEREGLRYRQIFADDDHIGWQLSDPVSGHVSVEIEGLVAGEAQSLERLSSRDVDLVFGRIEADTVLRGDVIALDALVPAVSSDHPLAMVTLSELRSLLGGRTRNWLSLGGPDLAVKLHLGEWEKDALMPSALLPGLRIGKATRHGDEVALADAVARDPGALGIVPLSMIGNAVPLVISGRCGLAIPATVTSIKTEDYPLTQPLFLHRAGARQPRTIRDLVAYIRSHEAQALIRQAGYVDQAIGRIPFDQQGDRIANAVFAAGEGADALDEMRRMISSLMQADRLTLTFRFRDGSSELDPQSFSNIQRLADAVHRGDFDGRELVFAGFSDGVGPSDGNLRLSERRALSVMAAVAVHVEEAPVSLSAEAFGESMPMACDDTAGGRQVNRRVEVWLRRDRAGQK